MKWIVGITEHLKKTFGLFLYGISGLTVLSSIYGVSRLATRHGEATINLFKWIAIIVVGYYLITGFGWLVKQFCKKVKKNYRTSKRKTPTKTTV